MSVKLSWRHFQLVLLIGYRYVFRLSDCLVLNANGQTFSPNASAEFECIIDPYTFSQAWYVDSISVADCGYSACSEIASNPERYYFAPNISAKTFIFKINPISLDDNEKVIKCFDGTNFTETSIFVTVNDNGGGGGGDGGDGDGGGTVLLATLIPSLTFVFIFAIVFIICCIMKQGTNSSQSANVKPASGLETPKVSANVKPASGLETPKVSDNESSSDEEHTNQSEMENEILDWMTDIKKLFIIMNETIWKMEDQRKDELYQKIEKDKQRSGHKETIWMMEVQRKQGTGHKVTYPATREPTLENQLEWIKEIIWMTEQDIEHIFEEINEEEGSMRTIVFSSVIMQVLQEDKDAYDNIKQATKRRNASVMTIQKVR